MSWYWVVCPVESLPVVHVAISECFFQPIPIGRRTTDSCALIRISCLKPLNPQRCNVHNRLYVPLRSTALPDKVRTSPGAHVLDHLAADGAGFPGSQVTIVAVGQVDAHFP